ncbi:MAG: restriction endonuclease subunit S [Eubacteriaceae bacterium]|uniref:Restriction endonuclease subunit S n=1 Tax=Candidatus Pseudoramibacter fermentans TaxID=2594427 RepID=A0A6L5GPA4_9FIRM|nr:restriction endonuclease subunit S [Candidatus Pseudoramibacter fermentans]RRF92191.1 MAG: restriction endonuclease subunit S [Eubacteriaceae bacterium]
MKKTFSEVLTIKNGKNQKKVENPEGKYPIYGSGGIMGFADNFICEANTVVIGRKGNINNPIFVEEPFWNVDTAFGLEADKRVLLPKYLYYFCKHHNFERYNRTVTIPSLTKSDLLRVKIDLPSLSKQQLIIDRLTKIEDILSKRRKELKNLDTLVKARFVEMFNLSNCDYKPLGECTDFVDYRGHTPKLSNEGTIRMVNAKSVGKGFFKYIDEYITEETYELWMHRGFGCPGDILFVTEGHTFGNTCLIPDDMKKFALGQRVITIKGHNEIKNAFLCSYMQTNNFWEDINVYRTGGTAQGIRSKDLVKVAVPIPPIEQQTEFTNFDDQINKSKAAIQKSIDKTQMLFDSLMQEYFS